MNTSPEHFAARHPKLTRWPLAPPEPESDFGSMVKRLVLGRGYELNIVDEERFTAKTKFMREQAEADGKVNVHRAEHDLAVEAANEAVERLRARFKRWPIGQSMVTLVWRRPVGDGMIWCREMADAWSDSVALIVETAKGPCSPADRASRMAHTGDDVRLAWLSEGMAELRGLERLRVPLIAAQAQPPSIAFYVTIETSPPYSVYCDDMTMSWRSEVDMEIEAACSRFALGLKRKSWPAGTVEPLLQAPQFRREQRERRK